MSAGATVDLKLRVMSGAHAGADVGLSTGTCQIGRTPDCQIQLTDWLGPPVELCVTQAGEVTWRSIQQDGDSKTSGIAEHGRPISLGSQVLVVGPVDNWPTDQALWLRWTEMQGVHEEPPALVVRSTRSPWRWLPGVLGALTMAAGLIIASVGIAARPHQDDAAPVGRLVRELTSIPGAHLTAEAEGGGLVNLQGWIARTQDRVQISRLVQRYPQIKVKQTYLVSQEVAKTLAMAAGSDVSATVKDFDSFEFSGEVTDIEEARRHLYRAAQDMGLTPAHVTERLTLRPKAREALSNAAFRDSQLRYQQLNDGSRLLQISPSTTTTTP